MTGSPIYKYEQLQKNEALCDILYINLYSPKKTVAHKKHSRESINTNKAKTAKTATKSMTLVDTWNYIIIILHQT